MKNETQIKCPNCGTTIDVQDILAHQLEEEIKQKYQAQIAEEKKKYEAGQVKLNEEKREFEKKKKLENELFQERLENQLKEGKKEIEYRLKLKLKEEQSEQFEAL
ncbi:hypothetical protein [Maribacter litoralis]|uniref:hypothetical protein n=1 Tax=Maribacter litoralis TaxID=2059726 RepID=UPI0031342781